jgi:LytS/YehU family sensor histidine kinase
MVISHSVESVRLPFEETNEGHFKRKHYIIDSEKYLKGIDAKMEPHFLMNLIENISFISQKDPNHKRVVYHCSCTLLLLHDS